MSALGTYYALTPTSNPQSAATIADLRAKAIETKAPVYVQGFTTAGDGGEGLFMAGPTVTNAVFSGTIAYEAPAVTYFDNSKPGTLILTVASVTSGTVLLGMQLSSTTIGSNVVFVTRQISGTTGGAGTYQLAGYSVTEPPAITIASPETITGKMYVDDGGTVIVPTGGDGSQGWVRAVQDGTINVKWYGAKGDNTTNDAPAIQKAINCAATFQYVEPVYSRDCLSAATTTTTAGVSVYSTNGMSVFFPSGTYIVNAPLDIKGRYVTLVGANKVSTILKAGTAIDAIIDAFDGVDSILSYFGVRHISLDGNQYSTDATYGSNSFYAATPLFYATNGIKVCLRHNYTLSNLVIEHCGNGLYLQNNWIGNHDNVLARLCGIGANLRAGNNSESFYHCSFNTCGQFCTKVKGTSEAILFSNCDMEFLIEGWPMNIPVTGGSWAANVATLTFAATPFQIEVGDKIVVSGVSPSGYNTISGQYFEVTAVTSTSISYVLGTNPGGTASGGIVALQPSVLCVSSTNVNLDTCYISDGTYFPIIEARANSNVHMTNGWMVYGASLASSAPYTSNNCIVLLDSTATVNFDGTEFTGWGAIVSGGPTAGGLYLANPMNFIKTGSWDSNYPGKVSFQRIDSYSDMTGDIANRGDTISWFNSGRTFVPRWGQSYIGSVSYSGTSGIFGTPYSDNGNNLVLSYGAVTSAPASAVIQVPMTNMKDFYYGKSCSLMVTYDSSIPLGVRAVGGAQTIVCTATVSSTTIGGLSAQQVTGLPIGMSVTSGTVTVPANTFIVARNIGAGTVTLSKAVTAVPGAGAVNLVFQLKRKIGDLPGTERNDIPFSLTTYARLDISLPYLISGSAADYQYLEFYNNNVPGYNSGLSIYPQSRINEVVLSDATHSQASLPIESAAVTGASWSSGVATINLASYTGGQFYLTSPFGGNTVVQVRDIVSGNNTAGANNNGYTGTLSCTANNTATLTGFSSTADLRLGMTLSGTYIPAGSTIIQISATSIVISNNATAPAGGTSTSILIRAGYNGTFVLTAATATSISYALPNDPGTWTSGGEVLQLARPMDYRTITKA